MRQLESNGRPCASWSRTKDACASAGVVGPSLLLAHIQSRAGEVCGQIPAGQDPRNPRANGLDPGWTGSELLALSAAADRQGEELVAAAAKADQAAAAAGLAEARAAAAEARAATAEAKAEARAALAIYMWNMLPRPALHNSVTPAPPMYGRSGRCGRVSTLNC